jgi:hypothetical protein
MGRQRVTSIRIDEDVFREAKELGLNVSKIAENALKEAIRRLKGENCQNNPNILHSHTSDGSASEVAGSRGFEPRTYSLGGSAEKSAALSGIISMLRYEPA